MMYKIKDGNLVIDAAKLKKGVIYIKEAVEVSFHNCYFISSYKGIIVILLEAGITK